MNSSNKIKSEKSKNVDEYIIGIPSDSHRNGQSENVLIVPVNIPVSLHFEYDLIGYTKQDDIKPEPSGNSNDQFEYDVTYLDEDSDTEQTQEPQSDTSHQSTGSKRGTRAQIQLLSDYMQKHTDLSKCHDIVAKNEAWNSLSVQLNEIGPPIRTADQWRRAWTCIKSQRKRQAEMHTSDVKKQKRNDWSASSSSGILPSH